MFYRFALLTRALWLFADELTIWHSLLRASSLINRQHIAILSIWYVYFIFSVN